MRSHLTLAEFELVGPEEKAEAHILWQGEHLTDFATASAAAVVNQARLVPPSRVPHQACH